VKGKIFIEGVIGQDYTPATLDMDLSNLGNVTEIDVYINSGGGHTTSGYAIARRLESLEAVVNTIANGMVASIATVIFQAPKLQNKGGKRKLYKNSEPFIHNPHWQPDMNSAPIERKDALELADALAHEELKLQNFYAEVTGKETNELATIMNDAKTLSPEQFIELGFADEVIGTEIKAFTKYQIAAFLNNNNKTNMNTEIANELSAINKFMAKLKTKLFKNASVTTKEDVTVYFDGESVEVGTALFTDEAMTTPAPDGEHTVDMNVYVVADGVVTEVLPDEDNSELEAAKAKIAELEAAIAEKDAIVNEKETLLNETKTEITTLAQKIKSFENSIVTGNYKVEPVAQVVNQVNNEPKSTMESYLKWKTEKK
jgi:ATP-dependent protease ClpP protease subunit